MANIGAGLDWLDVLDLWLALKAWPRPTRPCRPGRGDLAEQILR